MHLLSFTRRDPYSSALCPSLEEAPHLRHSLRLQARRRGGCARDEAEHLAGADGRLRVDGVRVRSLADAQLALQRRALPAGHAEHDRRKPVPYATGPEQSGALGRWRRR